MCTGIATDNKVTQCTVGPHMLMDTYTHGPHTLHLALDIGAVVDKQKDAERRERLARATVDVGTRT